MGRSVVRRVFPVGERVRARAHLLTAIALVVVVGCLGCGTTPAASSPTVAPGDPYPIPNVRPDKAAVQAGGQLQFRLELPNESGWEPVPVERWTVVQPTLDGLDLGYVTQDGLYTAPRHAPSIDRVGLRAYRRDGGYVGAWVRFDVDITTEAPANPMGSWVRKIVDLSPEGVRGAPGHPAFSVLMPRAWYPTGGRFNDEGWNATLADDDFELLAHGGDRIESPLLAVLRQAEASSPAATGHVIALEERRGGLGDDWPVTLVWPVEGRGGVTGMIRPIAWPEGDLIIEASDLTPEQQQIALAIMRSVIP